MPHYQTRCLSLLHVSARPGSAQSLQALQCIEPNFGSFDNGIRSGRLQNCRCLLGLAAMRTRIRVQLGTEVTSSTTQYGKCLLSDTSEQILLRPQPFQSKVCGRRKLWETGRRDDEAEGNMVSSTSFRNRYWTDVSFIGFWDAFRQWYRTNIIHRLARGVRRPSLRLIVGRERLPRRHTDCGLLHTTCTIQCPP